MRIYARHFPEKCLGWPIVGEENDDRNIPLMIMNCYSSNFAGGETENCDDVVPETTTTFTPETTTTATTTPSTRDVIIF